MSDNLCRDLDELLRECNFRAVIGLRQQGHLQSVARMMREEGATWDEIGAAIGWKGSAVEEWYGLEMERGYA